MIHETSNQPGNKIALEVIQPCKSDPKKTKSKSTPSNGISSVDDANLIRHLLSPADSLLTLAYSDLLADNPYANTKTKPSY